MFRHGQFSPWLFGGVHILLLTLALKLNVRVVWDYALLGMILTSFIAWASCFYRLRQVEDIPTSKIGSAAQGYVELFGRTADNGALLYSPSFHLRCCWFRNEIHRRDSKGRWQRESGYESDDPFLLRDGTGECLIRPEGAEIIGVHCDTRIKGDLKHMEWTIIPNTQLYAIGQFVTTTPIRPDLERRHAIWKTLTDWKQDPERMRSLDVNGNGQVDLPEWDLARRKAHEQVDAEMLRETPPEPVNYLQKPADGRIFLFSPKSPHDLRQTLLLWTWGQFAVMALLVVIATLRYLGFWSSVLIL